MTFKTDRSKLIRVDYDIWLDAGEDVVCLELTKRDVLALFAQIEYLKWDTRWLNKNESFDQNDYATDLEFRILEQMECFDCDAVADCLTNNANTRNALANAIRQLFPELNQPSTANPQDKGTPLLASGEGCDFDKLYGQCVNLINAMTQRNKDFLEQMASGNAFTLIAEIIQLFPAGDALALDDWFRFGQEIAQWSLTSYEAYETEAVLQNVACVLFCLSKDACSVNLQGLDDAFKASFEFIPPVSTPLEFLELITFIAEGGFTDRKIFEALFWMQLSGAILGIDLIPASFQDLALDVALGNDNPSSDWVLLCDCGWEYFHDFEVSDGGWVGNPYNGYTTANYVAGVGWDDVYFQDPGIARGLRGAWIKYTFSALTTITFVEATFTKTNGMTAIPSATTDIRSESPSFVTLASEPWIDATSPISHLGDIDTNNLLILVRCGVRNTNVATDPGGDAKIKTVRVRGTGINPFI